MASTKSKSKKYNAHTKLRRAFFAAASIFCALSVVSCGGNDLSQAASPLLTSDQQEVDQIAVSLLNDPAIVAARAQQLATWQKLSSYALADGKTTLNAALDAGVMYSLRVAADSDPARPKVVWVPAPGYSYSNLTVPDTRFFGDDVDRAYRIIPVSSAYSYEIHGKRNIHPSDSDFSFETIASIGGATTSTLYGSNLTIASDGTFIITVDSNSASTSPNHITLDPTTQFIYIRDTLSDWSTEIPNSLTVDRTDKQVTPAAKTTDEIKTVAVAEISSLFTGNNQFLAGGFSIPVGNFTFTLRSASDGLAGNGGAITQFVLTDDQALVITINPSTAQYVGIQTLDPWTRSIDYWDNTSSLTQKQIKPNSDGTYTYVISPKDPGYYNWLSTGGLHNGLVLLRMEDFTGTVDSSNVVKLVKVVNLSDLAATLPAGSVQVSASERATFLAQRKVDAALRYSGTHP